MDNEREKEVEDLEQKARFCYHGVDDDSGSVVQKKFWMICHTATARFFRNA